MDFDFAPSILDLDEVCTIALQILRSTRWGSPNFLNLQILFPPRAYLNIHRRSVTNSLRDDVLNSNLERKSYFEGKKSQVEVFSFSFSTISVHEEKRNPHLCQEQNFPGSNGTCSPRSETDASGLHTPAQRTPKRQDPTVKF
mmetsp:Transcript_20736/g.30079  ORF Transcript_20736/g.30079 Transcript_20736/m.30079 type:complete len:142 (-) Transcript_20736:42-467(-)